MLWSGIELKAESAIRQEHLDCNINASKLKSIDAPYMFYIYPQKL